MMQGLALIEKTIAAKEQPFTGILPSELAQLFADISLDTPHDNVEQTLEELEQLYLKDAVYFHHPRYVAHLNCPVASPAILAELILSSINSSVDTWDQSAGATLIEQNWPWPSWCCLSLEKSVAIAPVSPAWIILPSCFSPITTMCTSR